MTQEIKKQDSVAMARILEELKEAYWVGKDGNAVVNAENKREALRAFKELMRGDVGDQEADDLRLDDVGIGYLFSNDDGEVLDDSGDSVDWYVDWTGNEVSDYKVYVLNI